jgi:hypothetical protein
VVTADRLPWKGNMTMPSIMKQAEVFLTLKEFTILSVFLQIGSKMEKY